jgi:hypothetical protein
MARLRIIVAALGLAACRPAADSATPPTSNPGDTTGPSTEPVAPKTPSQILDELESRIAVGQDREKERVAAYDQVRAMPDDGSADYAFARAALAGRVAENRGAGAGKLVTEAETWARKTLERDPDYHDGAAVRMLGSLYVLAPGRLVEHGDSEDGLSMLEDLVESRPDNPVNHLRVAEAYIHLGDVEPSFSHLCAARAAASVLRQDERRLLDELIEDAGGQEALRCEQSP